MPFIMLLYGFDNPAATDENAVKAMFIYNFAKYFDWSSVESRPDFVIAVYGNSDVTRYLEQIAQRKKINGKTITIKIIYSPGESAGSQMLFIPASTYQSSSVIQSAAAINSSVIIISEHKDAFRKGAYINLLNIDGKLRFELNEPLLKNNNIKYSRELSSLSVK